MKAASALSLWALGVVALAPAAIALPDASRTYSTAVDFADGQMSNVVAANDSVTLDDSTTAVPFIRVALSARRTIAGSDTVTRRVRRERRNERVIDDATFDVIQPSEQNGAYEDYVPAADRAIGDITRFKVRHGEHRVRLRISAQELLRPVVDDTYEDVIAGTSLRTDAGRFYAIVALDNYDTRTVMLVGRNGEEPRPCRGKAGSFDEASDTVMLSLPRRCLGTPRWVRAMGSVHYSWPGGGDGDYYVDLAPDQLIDGPPLYSRRAWHPGVTR